MSPETSPRSSQSLAKDIERLTGLVPTSSMSGKKSTTFCIGGEYAFFVEPNSETQLHSLVAELRSAKQFYRILGAGSNLLVADSGVNEWVIRLGRGFKEFEKRGESTFWVQGSMPLMTLSRDLSEAGFSGLEFAGGIPASFGGAVRMNAGAHGGEMSGVISRVRFLSKEGTIEEIASNEISFSYRKSDFDNGSIVIAAEISLVASDPVKVKQTRAEHLAERKKRQPLTSPSAGSVFKNPASSQLSAGALIEQCDLKGFSIGGAAISTLHGNWIVNPTKSASSEDVTSLIDHCRRVVSEKTGILLEPEVVTWR